MINVKDKKVPLTKEILKDQMSKFSDVIII